MHADDYSDAELLALDHNDHRGAFAGYLAGSRHASDKQAFLLSWVRPVARDAILECGSSSGKTSIDFTRNSPCYCLGVDFDAEAVAIATAMRDELFPELSERCQFVCGDLSTMQFGRTFNKVLMPDFSEHVPDRVLALILHNLRVQLPHTTLYIYTPDRSHIFERLKQRNFLLKNPPGHINVKTRAEVSAFLQAHGWVVESSNWRPSSFPVLRQFEQLAGHVPVLGRLFQRRVVLTARPVPATPVDG